MLVGGDHELGFEVARDRVGLGQVRFGSEDADAFGEFLGVPAGEVGGADLASGGLDDGDGPGRVGRVVVGRLALVGGHDVGAAGGVVEAVGLGADLGAGEEFAVGVEEGDPAGVGLDRGFYGGGHDPVVDVDRVDLGAGDAEGVVGAELVEPLGVGRVGHVEHVDRSGLGVDDEQPLRGRVVGGDLGGRLVEGTGAEGAQRLQRYRGFGLLGSDRRWHGQRRHSDGQSGYERSLEHGAQPLSGTGRTVPVQPRQGKRRRASGERVVNSPSRYGPAVVPRYYRPGRVLPEEEREIEPLGDVFPGLSPSLGPCAAIPSAKERSPMITAKDLYKRYRNTVAVDRLSFEVRPGW
ncbi:hypothetical protein GCM10029992_20170 [Glycomyces albus]